jgi:hypothetical protein
LYVVRVEITVAVSIFWRIPIQPTDDPGQNTQLLSSIITHHPNLCSHLCKIWSQRESSHRHVFDSFGVEPKDTEVVDRVAVDGVGINFFVVVEYAVSPERSSSNHMSICHDVSVEY